MLNLETSDHAKLPPRGQCIIGEGMYSQRTVCWITVDLVMTPWGSRSATVATPTGQCAFSILSRVPYPYRKLIGPKAPGGPAAPWTMHSFKIFPSHFVIVCSAAVVPFLLIMLFVILPCLTCRLILNPGLTCRECSAYSVKSLPRYIAYLPLLAAILAVDQPPLGRTLLLRLYQQFSCSCVDGWRKKLLFKLFVIIQDRDYIFMHSAILRVVFAVKDVHFFNYHDVISVTFIIISKKLREFPDSMDRTTGQFILIDGHCRADMYFNMFI